MRRRALILAPCFLLPAHGQAESGTAAASFSILADMVRRVAGDGIMVRSLVPADTDAHAFQPSTSDLRALANAALLVENGLGLEGWMVRLAEASGFHGVRVVASTGVRPRRMTEGQAASIDPHAWQDPRNAVLYVRNIAEGLVKAFPHRGEDFHANASAFTAEIMRTDAWIADRIAAITREARRIVTTHDAFGYYGDRYGIDFLAAEGLSADAEPSAKAIAALVLQLKREKIRTVFLENMTDPRIAQMLAREAGAAVSGPLFSDALSGPDGPAPDYLTMLRHNTELMARAMERR